MSNLQLKGNFVCFVVGMQYKWIPPNAFHDQMLSFWFQSMQGMLYVRLCSGNECTLDLASCLAEAISMEVVLALMYNFTMSQ